MKKNLNIWNNGDQFHSVVVPSALRCALCKAVLFQAFEEDIWIIASKQCSECNGKGCAPIPPAELGL